MVSLSKQSYGLQFEEFFNFFKISSIYVFQIEMNVPKECTIKMYIFWTWAQIGNLNFILCGVFETRFSHK
jgi:hypothetical protein